MSHSFPEPSPILFFETVNAYQRSAAIRAAIELDVFTHIGAGKSTASEVAEASESTERGLRILCDSLTVMGFLTKQDGRYQLTQDSAVFLDRRSPAFIGGAIEFLLSPMLVESFEHLTEAVRKGGTALPEAGSIAPEHPVWVRFARAMAPMMTMPSQLMAQLIAQQMPERKLKVLDIAAGHGMFGIAVARQLPEAEITALDWPNVLEVAQANAEQAGVGERYHLLPGSAFEVDYGSDYDLILLTNFLHHFDPQTCEQLLRRVHAALSRNGKAVTLEFIPNEDRVSPPGSAMFSLVMLGSTPHGDAYTFSELERMFATAGFTRSMFHPLPPSFPQQIVVSDK
ncbi:MAG TPA: class I SAM-dependent methyltransferase [Pyrinomonadaceae bacterium]|jgi:ubiquinone/menaquinone biosynthesis C-methylase UbiE